jgi:hypothetical protein
MASLDDLEGFRRAANRSMPPVADARGFVDSATYGTASISGLRKREFYHGRLRTLLRLCVRLKNL